MDPWVERIIGWLVGSIGFIAVSLVGWGVFVTKRIHRLDVEKATKAEVERLDERLRQLTENVATRADVEKLREDMREDLHAMNDTLKDLLIPLTARNRDRERE